MTKMFFVPHTIFVANIFFSTSMESSFEMLLNFFYFKIFGPGVQKINNQNPSKNYLF